MIGVLQFHEKEIEPDELKAYLNTRNYVPDSLIDKVLKRSEGEIVFSQELTNGYWVFVKLRTCDGNKKLFVSSSYCHGT